MSRSSCCCHCPPQTTACPTCSHSNTPRIRIILFPLPEQLSNSCKPASRIATRTEFTRQHNIISLPVDHHNHTREEDDFMHSRVHFKSIITLRGEREKKSKTPVAVVAGNHNVGCGVLRLHSHRSGQPPTTNRNSKPNQKRKIKIAAPTNQPLPKTAIFAASHSSPQH